MIPQLWCARVVDEINWRLREDMIWTLWMTYLQDTVEKFYPSNELSWLRNAKQSIDFESEFQRLRIQVELVMCYHSEVGFRNNGLTYHVG